MFDNFSINQKTFGTEFGLFVVCLGDSTLI